MKIAVTGKGGVGKTSITAGLALAYAETRQVIAVDADPSLNLSTMLGLTEPQPLSKMKELISERARLSGGLVKMNPEVSDLIDDYSEKISDNLRIIVMGTVEGAGKGCMCPENALLRALLSNLVLKRDELVLVDLEAGFEPMSRGTIRSCDAVVVVSEPSANSVSVSKRLVELAGELGITKVVVVGNKVDGLEDESYLSTHLEVFHNIPSDKEFTSLSRSQGYPECTLFAESVKALSGKLEHLN